MCLISHRAIQHMLQSAQATGPHHSLSICLFVCLFVCFIADSRSPLCRSAVGLICPGFTECLFLFSLHPCKWVWGWIQTHRAVSLLFLQDSCGSEIWRDALEWLPLVYLTLSNRASIQRASAHRWVPASCSLAQLEPSGLEVLGRCSDVVIGPAEASGG